MSSNSSAQGSPLLVEGQFSGKIYWLNRPTGYTISLDNLQEQMGGRSFTEDISENIDRDTTFVPEVFEENNRVVRSTTISKTEIAPSDGSDILAGTITLDDVSEVKYREQNILMMDTTDAYFCIFRSDGHYYVAILARREVAQSAAAVLRAEYDEFGSMINPTRFSPAHIENIRQSLEAELRDTTIADYPEEQISRMQITGQNLENEEEFQRQRRRGEIQTHMIQTTALTPGDDDIVLSISRDGLVRIFSKTTIATYVSLLKNHVIANIHRDVEQQPSVNVFENSKQANSIFEENSTEIDD